MKEGDLVRRPTNFTLGVGRIVSVYKGSKPSGGPAVTMYEVHWIEAGKVERGYLKTGLVLVPEKGSSDESDVLV